MQQDVLQFPAVRKEGSDRRHSKLATVYFYWWEIKCKTMLATNITDIIPSNIFCVLCDLLPAHWLHSHLQSRNINPHEINSITPENTNSHGSIQCGNI